MKTRLGHLMSRGGSCALWVFLCFGLTSSVYLSWLHRLTVLAADGATASWLSMGLGYLMQATGMAAAARLLRRDPDTAFRRGFPSAALLFAASCPPALLCGSLAGAIGSGIAMNLLCGVIQGFYLYGTANRVDAGRRAIAFGSGYAAATLAVGLLSLIDEGRLLHSGRILLLYMPACAALVFVVRRLPPPAATTDGPSDAARALPEGTVPLACAVVLLTSAVAGVGFSFPFDHHSGAPLELWRMPYAVGLAAAGLVYDRNRQTGMLCTLAALVLPFILLGLNGQAVPGTVCQALDYLFFGLFSVFRAILLLDIAAETRRWSLAPLGLLTGRLGDAAGAAAGLLLGNRGALLITATALIFFPTVFLFIRLYRRLQAPEATPQRSAQEVFEAFCLRGSLSAREREVLRMMIDGRSNGEIAGTLFISESTVKYHVHNILQKTGCKNRADLQRKYTLALYPQIESDAVRAGG